MRSKVLQEILDETPDYINNYVISCEFICSVVYIKVKEKIKEGKVFSEDSLAYKVYEKSIYNFSLKDIYQLEEELDIQLIKFINET